MLSARNTDKTKVVMVLTLKVFIMGPTIIEKGWMIIDAHEERVIHPEKEGGQKPPFLK